MNKMSKKTPKSSKKRNNKSKNTKETIIVVGIFFVFILVVAYLFYFLNIRSSDETIAAIVNEDKITIEELDWWYKTSILPEYRDFITKQDFMMLSLIPQEILLQKAKKENIKVSKDEVERVMGLFIIENGFTLDEFETHLNSRDITINDIKKSFEIRATITKLLDKENVNIIEDENLFSDVISNSFQIYLDDLIDNSDIEIFPEIINKLVLSSFEETGEEICNEGKPVIRLYTTSSCEVCGEIGNAFENLVEDLVEDEKIEAFHWSLDTGDNLLTSKKEKGIPEEEVKLFKKYSPNKLVPAIVLGCKYKRIGSLGSEVASEFENILKNNYE